ncbi:uncharacterized protein LOC122369683 isoform X1 [Amphibalanus amphitrite]|uniref:uncharacterized protein LOC122369683 isoform X1 n=2 Tax=Amphibalanus amphitrite TaxID=1232801 RepID=UPI001C92B4A8|nr:uncharacterized protein LOC122369683 isoform X1 [Amphibalanus amphitrite]
MDPELRNTALLLAKGNNAQFEFVYKLYPQSLALKSQSKNKKPEELKKLDHWYHNELPKKIQSRAKEGGYLTHEELVMTIKWKLARGKWRPRLKELVTMNTPRLVQLETKKAIRQLVKKEDLSSAIQAMCNLKGVGPAMASAVLSVAQPDKIPFMSDECMFATQEVEGSIDYTNKEYLRMVQHVQNACERLARNGNAEWTPHRIEQVVFAHHVIVNNKPELLQGMPGFTANGEANGAGDGKENGAGNDTKQVGEPEVKTNGDQSPPDVAGSAENSCDGAASTSAAELDENTNDSIPSTEASSGIAPFEDSNMGDESNSNFSNIGDESNPADDGIQSGADDSASMPPPAAPAAEAGANGTGDHPAPADDPTPAPDGSELKRPADADAGADETAAKRARPDEGPAAAAETAAAGAE